MEIPVKPVEKSITRMDAGYMKELVALLDQLLENEKRLENEILVWETRRQILTAQLILMKEVRNLLSNAGQEKPTTPIKKNIWQGDESC
jgi:hypothetical protein